VQDRPLSLVSEINVTPLVDVVLVLLIIFMVVVPYLSRGIDVPLPFATTAESGDAPVGALVLTVALDGSLQLDATDIAVEDLRGRTARELARRPDTEVLVRGDERLRYGEVEVLLDELRAAGARQVALATRELEEGR
jgi:biopolymer transport protein ExbD